MPVHWCYALYLELVEQSVIGNQQARNKLLYYFEEHNFYFYLQIFTLKIFKSVNHLIWMDNTFEFQIKFEPFKVSDKKNKKFCFHTLFFLPVLLIFINI